jgi:Lon-like protease
VSGTRVRRCGGPWGLPVLCASETDQGENGLGGLKQRWLQAIEWSSREVPEPTRIAGRVVAELEPSSAMSATKRMSVSNDDTAPSTVPSGEAEPQTPSAPPPPDWQRPRARWLVLGGVIALVAGAAAFVFLAPARWVGVEDYIIAPGKATDTAPAISVLGTDSYAPEGEIAFTTVTIHRDATIWSWWRARSDASMELTPPESIDRDRSRDETRTVSQFQMDQSQDDATMVALQYLGYELVPEVEGAFVVNLVPDSPASEQLQLGDLIVRVDDTEIGTSTDLGDVIGALDPGDRVELGVRRAAEEGRGDGSDPDAIGVDVTLTLAEHPDRPGAGFLGVGIETPVRADAPFDINIDVGRVRGPSAGLAFSLAILDVITEGELTGGARVATTGTIAPSGLIGPVGGVPQKTEAAIRGDIDLFLVPPFEYVVASRSAGDRMNVACVQTFDDAVLALAELGGNGVEAAASFGAPAPEASPSLVDPDDGYFSCAEAEIELRGSEGLAVAAP